MSLFLTTHFSAQNSRDHSRHWLPELTLWNEALALVEDNVILLLPPDPEQLGPSPQRPTYIMWARSILTQLATFRLAVDLTTR